VWEVKCRSKSSIYVTVWGACQFQAPLAFAEELFVGIFLKKKGF